MKYLLIWLLIISMFCGLALLFYAIKRRKIPGARYFILLVIAAIIYNCAYIGEISSRTMAGALFWYNVLHAVIPLHPFLWLVMCLDYTQSFQKSRIIKPAFFFFPLAYYLIFFSNSYFHLYTTSVKFVSNGYFPVLVSQKALGFYASVLFITIIGLFCDLLYFNGFQKAARLYRRNYILMIVASVLPWLSVLLNTINASPLDLNYYPFAMIFSGLLYLFGIFRYNVFDTIPIATEMVYRKLEDAIALTDANNFFIDANESFIRLFPEFREFSKKKRLESFLVAHSDIAALKYDAPAISFCMPESHRYYSAKLISLQSEENIHIGGILSVKDITLETEHQNRLQHIAERAIKKAESNELSFLQAQISPHFINNTLSAASSMISRDDTAAKQLLVDLSEYLINCYRGEGSSAMTPLSQELQAVQTYVRICKARFGDRLNFILDAKELPELEVPRLSLQPLVENAIRHGLQPKQKGGTVCLSIRMEGALAFFEVWDDGVGIEPQRIQSLLQGEDNRQGVGIINIHKRLIRHYGAGLEIKSGGGRTSVSFSIPFEA